MEFKCYPKSNTFTKKQTFFILFGQFLNTSISNLRFYLIFELCRVYIRVLCVQSAQFTSNRHALMENIFPIQNAPFCKLMEQVASPMCVQAMYEVFLQLDLVLIGFYQNYSNFPLDLKCGYVLCLSYWCQTCCVCYLCAMNNTCPIRSEN